MFYHQYLWGLASRDFIKRKEARDYHSQCSHIRTECSYQVGCILILHWVEGRTERYNSQSSADLQTASILMAFLLSGAIAVTTGSSRFSETHLPHVLSDVSCQGSETNLLQCHYSTTVSCGATEDAAAVCQGRLGLHVCVLEYITCNCYGVCSPHSYLNSQWKL